jgi:hypothetical protein
MTSVRCRGKSREDSIERAHAVFPINNWSGQKRTSVPDPETDRGSAATSRVALTTSGNMSIQAGELLPNQPSQSTRIAV